MVWCGMLAKVSDAFGVAEHRDQWSLILAKSFAGEPFDTLTIFRELQAAGKNPSEGLLTDITSGAIRSAELCRQHVRRLNELAQRRSLARTYEKALASTYDLSRDVGATSAEVFRGMEASEQQHAVSDERTFLVRPSQLGLTGSGMDYFLDRLFWRGAKGLFVAAPKTGKSLAVLDLAICLAHERSWMGFKPYQKPVRVAVISREDGPALVRSRLVQLANGRRLELDRLDENIWINTREQATSFQIDNPSDVAKLAKTLKENEIEVVFIDVLNKLHRGEENSASDMSRVMAGFDSLRDQSGAAPVVIHHTTKGGGALTARGSSAIDGWFEWSVAMKPSAEDERIKEVSFRTKASEPREPIRVMYDQSSDQRISKIVPVVKHG
jgi:RecA-family ATPase